MCPACHSLPQSEKSFLYTDFGSVVCQSWFDASEAPRNSVSAERLTRTVASLTSKRNVTRKRMLGNPLASAGARNVYFYLQRMHKRKPCPLCSTTHWSIQSTRLLSILSALQDGAPLALSRVPSRAAIQQRPPSLFFRPRHKICFCFWLISSCCSGRDPVYAPLAPSAACDTDWLQ